MELFLQIENENVQNRFTHFKTLSLFKYHGDP